MNGRGVLLEMFAKLRNYPSLERESHRNDRRSRQRENEIIVRKSMVSLNLSATTSSGYFRNNVKFLPAKRGFVSISFATNSTEQKPMNPPGKPEIHLEFIGPQAGGDGVYPVERATAISGEKLLKNIMSDNKIELYAAYGKLMNCGGGGSCGTCIVEIIDGQDLLNDRTNTELRYLKKKPESWRLACQTIVGNKENSGKVVVQRLPQWKK